MYDHGQKIEKENNLTPFEGQVQQRVIADPDWYRNF
jgi:hypothetical protein